MHLDFTKISFSVESDHISISSSTIAPTIPAKKWVSSPVIESSWLSKYRIDSEEDSEQIEKVALESIEDLSVWCSPRIRNQKKVAEMKRLHNSSFSGQSGGNKFSLPGESL